MIPIIIHRVIMGMAGLLFSKSSNSLAIIVIQADTPNAAFALHDKLFYSMVVDVQTARVAEVVVSSSTLPTSYQAHNKLCAEWHVPKLRKR